MRLQLPMAQSLGIAAPVQRAAQISRSSEPQACEHRWAVQVDVQVCGVGSRVAVQAHARPTLFRAEADVVPREPFGADAPNHQWQAALPAVKSHLLVSEVSLSNRMPS